METVGKITLYDDGAFFYIGHADNPKVCKIDRDIGLWCNLKADMKRYGVLRYKKKTGLCFDKRKGKLKSMSFPAYLYARYNGLPLKDMRGRAVRKKNRSTGDILDYTSSNLYVIGQG